MADFIIEDIKARIEINARNMISGEYRFILGGDNDDKQYQRINKLKKLLSRTLFDVKETVDTVNDLIVVTFRQTAFLKSKKRLNGFFEKRKR